MPFPFDEYPWAKFEDLNIAYMIHRLGLIISEANAKLQELDAWKTATEQDLESWKNSTMDLIADWEREFMADVNQWEHDTEQDLAQWKIDVLAELGTWKTNFETLFNQTFTDLVSIKNAAESARDSAISAANTATEEADRLSDSMNDLENMRGLLGIIPLSWESGGLYQASGIEYADSSRSRSDFFEVEPGSTIYLQKSAEFSAMGVFEFASDDTTTQSVNPVITFYSFQKTGGMYKIGSGTHYIRFQIVTNVQNVGNKANAFVIDQEYSELLGKDAYGFVTPSLFESQEINTDAKMIQAAVNYAFAHQCDIAFERRYVLGNGEYILLNKYNGHVETSGRFITRFFGIGGQKNNPQSGEILGAGITHNYSGNIFTTNDAYSSESGDFIFENLTFESVSGAGCNVFNMNCLMRLTVKGCFFKNIDSVAKNTYITATPRSHYWQDVTFEDCTIIGGKGWAMFADGVYAVDIRNVTVEHRDGGFRFGVVHANDYYSKCRNLKIENCIFEGISGEYVTSFAGNNNPNNAWAIYIELPLSVTIRGCYFEQNYKNILIRNGGTDAVYSVDIENCWLGGYFYKKRYGTENSYTEIADDKYLVTIGGTLGDYQIEKCATERGGIVNAPSNTDSMIILYLANSLNPAAKGERDYTSFTFDAARGTWKGNNASDNTSVVTGGNNNANKCKTYANINVT